MNVKELKYKVEQLDLKLDILNDGTYVIYTPYNANGFKINGKFYDNYVLTESDITDIRGRYVDIRNYIEDNNFGVTNITYVEYNTISNISIAHEDEGYMFRTSEFDTANLGPSDTVKPYQMFEEKLKKHEKDKLMSEFSNFLSYHNIYGRQQIITNLIKNSNFFEPLTLALDENLLDIRQFIEALFSQEDWIYHENEKASLKMFKILSIHTPDFHLDLSQGRGYLPDVVVNNKIVMKNICKNWMFSDTNRILSFLIQDEHWDGLNVFLHNYPPELTHNWDDITSQFLLLVDNTKMIKKFLNDWVDLNSQIDGFLDFLETLVIRMFTEDLKLCILKIIDSQDPQTLFNKLLDAYIDSNIMDLTTAAPIFDLFSKYDIDYMYGDIYILEIYKNNQEKIDFFIRQKNILQRVLELEKYEYIPDSVSELFLV